MTQQHPITPPLELYGQWYDESPDDDDLGLVEYVATQAARWGADQELKACCEWLLDHGYDLCSPEMRKDRRPKPPSLKEQALEALDQADNGLTEYEWPSRHDIIRRALESLPD